MFTFKTHKFHALSSYLYTHIISHISTAISALSTVTSNLQSKLQRDIRLMALLSHLGDSVCSWPPFDPSFCLLESQELTFACVSYFIQYQAACTRRLLSINYMENWIQTDAFLLDF